MANSDRMANIPINGMANTITSSPTYQYRDPDKRRVYQRELMRRRRRFKYASGE